MADDGQIIIGIQADISDIKKKLEEVEGKGKQAARGIGDAFAAIAGALAGAKIVSAFQSAIAQAGKLEQSMLKVASTARSMGESTSKAQKAAMDLAQDGFLSASQAAQTLSNLMATGLNVDQAKKFITASKDITAFGNTIGDAAQATEDLSLGLLRGSALVIDNASPALKSLANKYQQLVDTQGKTAAAQYAYNEIVKTGAKFQGDAAKYMDTATGAQARFTAATDAASAAVGKSLQPMLKSLFNSLSSLVDGFTKWFSGLSDMSQTVIAVGVGVAALIPVIASLNGALSLLAVNPIVLMLTAAVLATTALAAAFANLEKSPKEIVKRFKETSAELDNLGNKVKELNAINKKTIAQELELIDSKEALRKKSKELGLDYDVLASKAKNYAEVVEKIKFASREKSASDIDTQRRQNQQDKEANELRIKAAEKAYGKNALSIIEGGGQFVSTPGFGTVDIRAALESRQQYESRGKTQDLERAQLFSEEQEAKKLAGAQTGGKWTEQRFLETQDKLKQIELNRIETIGKAERIKDADERKRQQDRAYQDAEILAKTEVNALRSAYAEYIEDKAMADKLALDKQTDDAIRAVRLQEEAGELIKEQAEYRIGKIREKQIQKEAALRAQSFADTLNAASGITKGLGQIRGGDIAGGASSALSAAPGLGKGLEGLGLMTAGGTASKLLGSLGTAGTVVAAVGGVVSTISDFFGKSDAERAREAADQKLRDEVALEISKKQEEHQRNMLALQEAQAKLPFENLTRKLRLIDIKAQQQTLSGVDEKTVNSTRLSARQSVIQQTLNEQGGKIAEGSLFAGVDSSPESLIKFLNERALKNTSNNIVAHLLDFMGNGTPYGLNTLLAVKAMLPGYKDTTDPEIYSLVDDALTKNIASMQLAVSLAGSNTAASAQDISVFEAAGSAMRNVRSQLPGLVSEVTQDTSRAESLLSVLEQSLTNEQEIKNNTKRTADNTGRLTNMRENNILDLAGGGIRGFGSFFSGAFNSVESLVNPRMPALATPSAISNSLSVASLTRSWQDRAADGIENLVKIQTEALRLLAEIALNTDAQGQVQGSMTSAQLQDIMANIRSRIV